MQCVETHPPSAQASRHLDLIHTKLCFSSWAITPPPLSPPAPPALVLAHQLPASSCTREVLASSESCAALIEALESSTRDHSMAIYWEVCEAEKHEGNVAAYNEALGASCRSAGFG